MLPVFLAVTAFVALVAFGGWWWFSGKSDTVLGRNTVSAAPAPTATPAPMFTVTPNPTQTATNLPAPAPITLEKTKLRVAGVPFTPTATATKTATATRIPPTPTPTKTPTITPTPTPATDYTIIANETISEPDRVYPVISGWIVEKDGVTPRPAAVELRYPGGSMRYPRPNNVDVANGHYEFLVSPGVYDLVLLDGDRPAVQIVVSENQQTRYEVSFQHNRTRRITAALSNPWNEAQAPNPATVATMFSSPVATPTPVVYTLFIPIVLR